MSCGSKKHGRARKAKGGPGLPIKKKHGHVGMMRTLMFGALLGLVVGLLFAPKPGSETLEKLSRKRGRLLEKLIRTLPV